MIDGHVHSRDPGLAHKEDWASLSASAYKGGVIAVCDMPNTIPPTMDRKTVEEKIKAASRGTLDYRFFLGVSPENLPILNQLVGDPSLPICGLKIYYGNSTGNLMFSDLDRLGQCLTVSKNLALVFHSEDQGCIDFNSERLHPTDLKDNQSFSIHSQIRSSACALKSTKTIIDWATANKIPIHIAHLTTPGEMKLILEANERGASITAEVTPHHLLFSTADYPKHGPFLKMNPPLRSPREVEELLTYFKEGKISIFATDHAPHTRAEKLETIYEKCPSGVPSIEFFTPLLLTLGNRSPSTDLDHVLHMGSSQPASLFGFQKLGKIAPTYDANLVWVEEGTFIPTDKEVTAKCGWSPYVGTAMDYRIRSTWHRGQLGYSSSDHQNRESS